MNEPDLADERSIPPRPLRARAVTPHPPPTSSYDRILRHIEIHADDVQRFEYQAQAAEALRAAAGQLKLWQQLTRLTGTPVTVQTSNIRVAGHLDSSHPDFLAVSCGLGWTHLIRLDAGTTVSTAPGVIPTGPVTGDNFARRYRLQLAALELERCREPVRVVLAGGALATGTIDQVGKDYLQLTEHPLGEVRRTHAITARSYLPLTAVAVISFQSRSD